MNSTGKRKDESVKDTDGKGGEGGRESEKREEREKVRGRGKANDMMMNDG